MTYYPDLGQECMAGYGADVRAIGWLHPDHPLPTGKVSARFVAALKWHIEDAWQLVTFNGLHACEIAPCPFTAPPTAVQGWRRLFRRLTARSDPQFDRREVSGSTTPTTTGYRNLWIPTADCVYIAPEMVLHYVRDHEYRPPDEFIEAVLACPKQGSPAFEALLDPFLPKAGDMLFIFDRNWDEIRRRAYERAQAWTRRGMCPTCQFWQYLLDDDPAVHCDGVALVHMEGRDGRRLARDPKARRPKAWRG